MFLLGVVPRRLHRGGQGVTNDQRVRRCCLCQDTTSSAIEASSEVGADGRKRQWPAYVPPTHPNPHMFIQPSAADTGPNGLVIDASACHLVLSH